MADTEALSRKKVRAAHCASVTCMIMQSKEMLDSGEELGVAKLEQKKQALLGPPHTFKQFCVMLHSLFPPFPPPSLYPSFFPFLICLQFLCSTRNL